MHPSHLEYLAHKKRFEELRMEAERDRLLQAAKSEIAVPSPAHRRAASWVGAQMVKWGSRLQYYGTLSSSEVVSKPQ